MTIDLLPSPAGPRAIAETNPVLAYLSRLSPESRRTMVWALDQVAGWASAGRATALTFEWHHLRAEHTEAIWVWLAHGHLAPASANLVLTAMRGVLRSCRRRRLLAADDYEDAVDLPPIPGERLAAGRSLSEAEVRSLFAVCDPATVAGSRDGALFGLGFGGGLRRFELVAVDIEDFDREPGTVRVRRGKGNKGREVPLPAGAAASVAAWLRQRGDWSGPLFVAVDKAGNICNPRRLSAQAVFDVCAKRAAEAGIARFSPHDMRRTYITNLLDAGADIAIVQRLVGHADPGTTSNYDRRPEEAKRKTAELLRIPFAGLISPGHVYVNSEG